MPADRVERKLAAILAADVAGYSRLMGEDEERTLTSLRAHRTGLIDPAIAEHRGRIANTAGDSLLVEFASVVDAVRCAVAIQQGMALRNSDVAEAQRLVFRMGINVGDVMVQGQDLLGDGINIAARLEQISQPGSIYVSRVVYEQAQGKVPYAFDDLGPQQVKNIAQPVQTYRVRFDGTPERGKPAASPQAAVAKSRPARSKRWLLAAWALAALTLLGVGGWLAWNAWHPASAPNAALAPAGNRAVTDRPSIAVMPFQNMSADAGQEYFADGITEDIITDLSKLSGLFVIARNSTFTYKGKAVDLTQVGRELGVKYVLEGSVQKAANQVRINAQLIDAETGGHLWAERYDGTITDIFSLQDQVTKKIVTALAANLSAAQQALTAKKEHTSPEAYEAFLKGMDHFHRQRPEDFRQAIDFFNKATSIDPNYARANAALAATYWEIYKRWWSQKLGITGAMSQAERYLKSALRNPTALAYQVDAGVLAAQRRYEDAADAAQRGIAMDANDPDGYIALANVLSLSGRPEEALRLVERAMQLNPYYPASYLYELGLARFCMRRYPQAADALERATALNPDDRWSARVLLAAYGHLGRTDRAAAVVKSAAASSWGYDPLTVRSVSFWYPFKRAEDAEALAEGLRKAGLPD